MAGRKGKKMSLITVLLAARNGETYISQQLDSILDQKEDIRILVSDDCSSDHTREILERYRKQWPDRILALFRREPSGGAGAHFLKLMKLMADGGRYGVLEENEKDPWGGKEEKGKGGPWERGGEYAPLSREERFLLEDMAHASYFMLSDQDDVWKPQKASMLLKKLHEMEGERKGKERKVEEGETEEGKTEEGRLALLVHSDLTVTDQELNPIAGSFFQYQNLSPERCSLSQLLVQNNVTGGAVMFHRGMLPFLKTIPDTCLMHDAWLALIASCFGRIGWVDSSLYYYRQHGENALGAGQADELDSARQRLKDGSRARENYRKMFGQARCFLEIFKDQLDEEQRQVLEAFVRMPRCSRIGKIALILRYGFTKNTLARTLGQMMFIGD